MDDTGTIIRDHDSIAKQYLKSVLPPLHLTLFFTPLPTSFERPAGRLHFYLCALIRPRQCRIWFSLDAVK
jgi:hypothetical protein